MSHFYFQLGLVLRLVAKSLLGNDFSEKLLSLRWSSLEAGGGGVSLRYALRLAAFTLCTLLSPAAGGRSSEDVSLFCLACLPSVEGLRDGVDGSFLVLEVEDTVFRAKLGMSEVVFDVFGLVFSELACACDWANALMVDLHIFSSGLGMFRSGLALGFWMVDFLGVDSLVHLGADPLSPLCALDSSGGMLECRGVLVAFSLRPLAGVLWSRNGLRVSLLSVCLSPLLLLPDLGSLLIGTTLLMPWFSLLVRVRTPRLVALFLLAFAILALVCFLLLICVSLLTPCLLSVVSALSVSQSSV